MNQMVDQETHKEAKINNQVVEYNFCTEDKAVYTRMGVDTTAWKFLGIGKIYKINGVKQEFKEQYYFWQRNPSA